MKNEAKLSKTGAEKKFKLIQPKSLSSAIILYNFIRYGATGAPSLAAGVQTHPSAIHPTTKPYFLLLKLLLWLFVRDEGEIFGKAERLEAPDDLQKDKE